jgi:transcriptional regulator GlxA family with amidase domain
MSEVAVLLFEDFEAVDKNSAIEIFAMLKDHYHIEFYSLAGGPVKDEHGVPFDTLPLENIAEKTDILLIPGGRGTRKQVDNPLLIEKIRSVSELSRYVLTIGTGSALLAKSGLLDTMTAATDSQALSDWIQDISAKIKWNRRAVWIVDDKYYTSSGVQSSKDMTLAFLTDMHGGKFAKRVASTIN